MESEPTEIVIYPHRLRITAWFIIVAGCSLFFFLFFLFLLILMILSPASRNGGAIPLALFMGGVGIICLWPIRTFSQILSSGKPTLIITQQGIQVGNIYPASGIVLSWEEIEAIFLVRNGIEENLAIRPKKVALSRFSLSIRFRLRFNMMTRKPSVVISESLLEKSVREILRQLWAQYEQELEYYHIQMEP